MSDVEGRGPANDVAQDESTEADASDTMLPPSPVTEVIQPCHTQQCGILAGTLPPQGPQSHYSKPPQQITAAAPPQPVTNETPHNPKERVVKKAQRTKRANLGANFNQQAAAVENTKNTANPKPEKKVAKAVTNPDAEEEGESGEEEEEEAEGESVNLMEVLSKIGNAILWFLRLVWGVICTIVGSICRFFMAAYKATRTIWPVVLGTSGLVAIAWLLGSYVLEEHTVGTLPDTSARLFHIIKRHAWSLLPVVTGMIVYRWGGKKVHGKFVQESLDQLTVLFINTVVMATHLEASRMHWLTATLYSLVLYRFFYWLSLLYFGKGCQTATGSPSFVVNLFLLSYNLNTILRECLGWMQEDDSASGSASSESEYFYNEYEPIYDEDHEELGSRKDQAGIIRSLFFFIRSFVMMITSCFKYAVSH